MSVLWIVAGLPGSGKTSCASQLATMFNLQRVGTDDLRAELGIPPTDRTSEGEVYSLLSDRVLQILQQGIGVVADATFYLRSYREALCVRAAELNHEIMLIQVVTPPEICRWRVSRRQRRGDNGYGGVTSTSVFDDVLRATEAITASEITLYSGGADVDGSVEPVRICRQWGGGTSMLAQWQAPKGMIKDQRGFAQLRRLFRSDQAPVAFIGSGLSTNYPSWFDFVLRIARKANHTSVTQLEAATSSDSAVAIKENIEALTAIADECLAVERNNRADYAPGDLVQEVFGASQKSRPTVFDSLVRAPFQFFITTNYDRNIEEAFAEVTGWELPVVTARNPGRVLDYVRAGQPFVFKVHGCVKFDGPFVIGADDYSRIIRETADVQMLLKSIFATHSVVFVGYGHRDPHITGYLHDVRAAMRGGGASHATFVKDVSWVFDVPTHYARRFGVHTIRLAEWSELEPTLDELSFLELSRQPGVVIRRLASSYERLVTRGSGESLWGAVLYSQASLLIGRTSPAQEVWAVVEANRALQAAVRRTNLLHLTYCIVIGSAMRRAGRPASAAELLSAALEIAASDATLSRVLRAHAFRQAAVYALWPAQENPEDSDLALALLQVARIVISGGSDESATDTRTHASEELLNIDKYIAIASRGKDPAGSMRGLLSLAREAREGGHPRSAAWCEFNALQTAAQHDLSIFAGDPEQFSSAVVANFESLGILEGVAEAHLLRAQVLRQRGRDEDSVTRQIELASAHALILGDELLRQRCVAEGFNRITP